MVFSASSISQFSSDENAFQFAGQQLFFTVLGFLGIWFLRKMSINFNTEVFIRGKKRYVYDFFSTFFIAVCTFGLLATVLWGDEVNGNKNWLKLPVGPAIQISEPTKLVVCIFIAVRIYNIRHLFEFGNKTHAIRKSISSSLWVLMVFGLIALEKDMGTLMVLGLIVVGEMFIAGVKMRIIAPVIASACAGAYVMLTMSQNRLDRLMTTYYGCANSDTNDLCFQQLHAKMAFISGGFMGKGPGQSREKWFYLPEPHTDFILAIVGEEFGLVGSLLVIFSYIGLIILLIAIIRNISDVRAKYVTAGVICWVFVQATFNIGAVLTIFPVIGVPLPLMSYGGTAMISLLLAFGVILSFISDNKTKVKQIKQSLNTKTVYAK